MEGQTTSRWTKTKRFLRKNILTLFMISSIVLGFIAGVIIQINTEPLKKEHHEFLSFVGEILIRLLKCAAVPLIVACIIVAIVSLDLVAFGTIAWQLTLLVVAMKLISTTLSLAAVLIIHPGEWTNTSDSTEPVHMEKSGMLMDVFLDLFRNLIPNNMISIYNQLHETKLTKPEDSTSDDLMTWEVEGTYRDSMNLLGMIFVAIIIGISLNVSQEKEGGFTAVTSEVYEVSMALATWIVWSAPVFLFFLVMSEVMQIEDYVLFLKTWGFYILTMHAPFVLIILVQYPLALFLLAGVNPFKFYLHMAKAIITGYVTASSIATMPITIDCQLRDGIDERMVRFVVPIGTNLNKIGSTCHFSVSLVFVAQMLGAELKVGEYFTIAVLSILGSIVAPAVPFSAIAVMIMLLSTLGLQQNLVAGILAVEWINDRGVTAVNVLGNCVCPKILEKWNKKLLRETGDQANEIKQKSQT